MRQLFVGFSGPVGYDYWRGGDRSNWGPPNAVLEDVTGLLLCYDQLLFLSKDFCPEDMWDLPYVTFLADDSATYEKCGAAIEQYEEILKENGSPRRGDISNQFTRTIATMTGTDGRIGIDNHTKDLRYADYARRGDSADVGAAVIDVGIVTALDLPHKTDVLTNSIASTVLDQELERPPNGYSEWHIDVAHALGRLKVSNQLGPRGSYHEELEEIRGLPAVKAFRQHLANLPESAPPAQAAREMQQIADEYARKVFLDKVDPRPWYTTVGRAALGGLSALPFGWVITAGQVTHEEVSHRRLAKKSAWVAFVVSLQRD